jgi:hypothetical protein
MFSSIRHPARLPAPPSLPQSLTGTAPNNRSFLQLLRQLQAKNKSTLVTAFVRSLSSALKGTRTAFKRTGRRGGRGRRVWEGGGPAVMSAWNCEPGHGFFRAQATTCSFGAKQTHWVNDCRHSAWVCRRVSQCDCCAPKSAGPCAGQGML